MTLARALHPGGYPEEAVKHLRQHVVSGSMPSSIFSGGLLRHSGVEHGMVLDGWKKRNTPLPPAMMYERHRHSWIRLHYLVCGLLPWGLTGRLARS